VIGDDVHVVGGSRVSMEGDRVAADRGALTRALRDPGLPSPRIRCGTRR